MKSNLKVHLGVFLIVLTLYSSGCFASRQTEVIAEKFLIAVVQNDLATLQEVIEPQYHADLFKGVFYLTSITSLVSHHFGDINIDYTELRVQTISNDRKNAVVHFEVKLLMKVLGSQIIIPSSGHVYLTRIDGKWYVTDIDSGSQLPL